MSAKALRRKGLQDLCYGLPFPNYALGETELPTICRCIYDGGKFYVEGLDMHTLFYNGCFGASSLTHRGPSYDDASFVKKPYYIKSCENKYKKFCFEKGGFLSACKRMRLSTKEGGEQVQDLKNVNANEESCSHLSKDPGDISVIGQNGSENASIQSPEINTLDFDAEKLVLMPEEVIFLSFGVGCLSIENSSGQQIEYDAVWSEVTDQNPNFPVSYAVYHYFRSKNWIPKCGKSYGASYVLYECSPEAYHSAYIVHIVGFPSQLNPTWTQLHAWQRLSQHVGKTVLLVSVKTPDKFLASQSTPRQIFSMKIKEICIDRWRPSSSLTSEII